MLSVMAGKPPPMPMRVRRDASLEHGLDGRDPLGDIEGGALAGGAEQHDAVDALCEELSGMARELGGSTLPSVASGVGDATQNPRIASVITSPIAWSQP